MKFSKHYSVIFIVIIAFITNALLFLGTAYFYYNTLAIIILHVITLYIGVTRYRFNYFSKTYNKGNQKGLSLTFDDGPNAEFTEDILTILAKYNAPATFFVIGKNIAENEEILKKIDLQHHIIGNHSNTHNYFFNTLKADKIQQDILLCNEKIEAIIHKKPRFFRAPFGLTSPNTAKALTKLEHVSISWDFRSFDTMSKNKEMLLAKLKRNAKKSSIMLLHDNNALTASILDDFLSFCKQNGIEIVSLDKMIGEKAYF